MKYNVKVDLKNRITIRNPKCHNYRITEYENGTIILEPILDISSKTLKMMDLSVNNIYKNIVSDSIKI